VADGAFGVEVVTPEQALVAGSATAVMLRTSIGEMTVLNGHTALVGDMVPGLVRVEQPDGTIQRLAVHGGFIRVDTRPGAADDLIEGGGEGGPLAGMTTRVTLLAGVAERAENIDVPRAERAQAAATQLVADLAGGRSSTSDADGEGGDLDLHQAQAALARAELRLEVAAASS
jgi:F-type H+-transporting ATPase subunit epsilon